MAALGKARNIDVAAYTLGAGAVRAALFEAARRGAGVCVRLEGCPAAIGCAIETISEGGDHWLVLGRVLTLYRSEEAFAPLVFHAGRYATLEEREP